MNYHLRSKPKSVIPWKTLIIVALFVFLSVLGFLFPNVLRGASTRIARPLWYVRDAAVSRFAGVVNFFKFKSTLINQNLALQDEIASLKQKEIDYDTILAENQSLKAQFGRMENKNRVLAAIISKPPASPYDTFVLDVGSVEGVVLSDKVFISDTVIVGVITSVTSHTSLVTLFSGGGNKQQAILARTGASYELVGEGGANLELEVPKDTDILWGDSFMYPGLSTSVIASVYYIDTNSQSSFKTIYLRIPGNVFQTRFVFVQKGE